MPTRSDIPASTRPVAAAFGAILMLWIAPRRTAARCRQTPLWAAWLAHLLAVAVALAIAFVGIVFMDAAISARSRTLVSQVAWDLLCQTLLDVWVGAVDVRGNLIQIGIFLASIEVAFVFVAFLLIPLSARDEPLRQTCRRAVRTTWLWTGTAIPFLIVLMPVLFELELQAVGWRRMTPWHAVLAQRQAWSDARPWYVRHEDDAMALAIGVLGCWALGVLLRAATTGQAETSPSQPPICEVCGYNLSHTPPDSRCPECGTPVCESVQPGLRQPNDWEQGRGLRPIGALLRCGLAAAFRPDRFFRTMQTRRGLGRARTFFVIHLGLTALVVPISAVAEAIHDGRHWADVNDVGPYTLVLVLFTCVWLLSAASVVGFVCRLLWKENAMPGVAKVFCYLTGLYVLLAIVCGLCVTPAMHLLWVLTSYRRFLAVYAIAAWAVLSGLCLLVCLAACLVAVRRIRYANS